MPEPTEPHTSRGGSVPGGNSTSGRSGHGEGWGGLTPAPSSPGSLPGASVSLGFLPFQSCSAHSAHLCPPSPCVTHVTAHPLRVGRSVGEFPGQCAKDTPGPPCPCAVVCACCVHTVVMESSPLGDAGPASVLLFQTALQNSHRCRCVHVLAHRIIKSRSSW